MEQPLSMLYVEDDPEARKLITTAISVKFRAIRLFTAENGAAGLDLYRLHRPDVVLTDIKMPVMDGLTMATEIRALHPKAVIAVISAYCDTQEYLQNARDLDITECVVKPVDYQDLFATITSCITKVAAERE